MSAFPPLYLGSQSSAPVVEASPLETSAAAGDLTQSQTQSSAASTSFTHSLTSDSKSSPASPPSLSSLLELDGLWTMLSDCLDALAATYDPHAVLVLQPTVEAFFLVHADQNDEGRPSGGGGSGGERRSGHHLRSRRLPSFHTISDTESMPGSPAPYEAAYSPLPGTAGTEMEGVDPYAHLPPDTARFLKFAGEIIVVGRSR